MNIHIEQPALAQWCFVSRLYDNKLLWTPCVYIGNKEFVSITGVDKIGKVEHQNEWKPMEIPE